MTTTEMREPTFLVLAALAGGKKHGYGLIADAEQISNGRVTLNVGTLYAALERLGEQGLVAEAGEEIVDGRHRRYYELTDGGLLALETQIERLESNAARARKNLAARVTPNVTGAPKGTGAPRATNAAGTPRIAGSLA